MISFTGVTACGTSTAISVPCMFDFYDQDDFSTGKSQSTENALDVLNHSGVTILWRDNNSNSKGVADRVPVEDFRSPETNPVCDEECRDVGMLAGLQDFIDRQPEGDILIVLHQLGSHGPHTSSATHLHSGRSSPLVTAANSTAAARSRSATATTTPSCTPIISWGE